MIFDQFELHFRLPQQNLPLIQAATLFSVLLKASLLVIDYWGVLLNGHHCRRQGCQHISLNMPLQIILFLPLSLLSQPTALALSYRFLSLRIHR